jgi:hypothetical protein
LIGLQEAMVEKEENIHRTEWWMSIKQQNFGMEMPIRSEDPSHISWIITVEKFKIFKLG